jgi:hypothetical protein
MPNLILTNQKILVLKLDLYTKTQSKSFFRKRKLFKNFGFNVSGRYNTSYLWQSSMVDGMIDAATVIDAQINYGIPSLKSTLKLGVKHCW